ncbi:MAG: glutamate--tRNA ligase [Planctomycetota bacterium]|nr:MAG: glutamate--tRNA ligase [Planctomycetota bacterium]
MQVRTRFAPSPTGYLHIGGVRTALFNWLFARKHGGAFILRIDDTDVARNLDEALEPILSGLKWLGIDWDEGPGVGGPHAPYFQSQRADRHQAAVEQLLGAGHAYRDYALPEELDCERKAAQAAGKPFLYSRRFAAFTDADAARFTAENRPSVVRLKMPREGALIIDDAVRGRVEFAWNLEQDHVIQRANGSCLYHLASVVDDNDYEITHVIRAEEHLSNTPRQAFIALSLGYSLPAYAHLPLVAEPGSRTKLSKRKLEQYLKNADFKQISEHGKKIAQRLSLAPEGDTFNPVIVDFYRAVGYLPWAIDNYLALLGWSYDDKTEFFSRAQLVEGFSLERINSSPASFDPKKLWAVQDHYMLSLSTDEKLSMMLPFLVSAQLLPESPSPDSIATVRKVIEASGDRLKVAGDILAYADFFLLNEPPLDEAAVKQRLAKPGVQKLLTLFSAAIAELDLFEPGPLEEALKLVVTNAGVKAGDLVHAVRIAVTGKPVGPGLYDCLTIIGRDQALARIERVLPLCG